jgi:positive regulator of sigma E activity
MKSVQRVESDIHIESPGGGGNVKGRVHQGSGLVSGSISPVEITLTTTHRVINQLWLLDPETGLEDVVDFDNNKFSPREGQVVYFKSISCKNGEKIISSSYSILSKGTSQIVPTNKDFDSVFGEKIKSLFEKETALKGEGTVYMASAAVVFAAIFYLHSIFYPSLGGYKFAILFAIELFAWLIVTGIVGYVIAHILLPGYDENLKQQGSDQRSIDSIAESVITWVRSA